eukprot:6182620-Pleurochrysis_carterae.AAC.1
MRATACGSESARITELADVDLAAAAAEERAEAENVIEVSPFTSGVVPGPKSRRSAWLDFIEI